MGRLLLGEAEIDDPGAALVANMLVSSLAVHLRLEAFYLSYLDAIDEPIWIRIVLHSGLASNELTRRYVSRRVEQILQALMAEVRHDFGPALARMDDADLYERIWDLQASFIYGLIRKHVWQLPVMEDRPRLVAGRISQFLQGLAAPA